MEATSVDSVRESYERIAEVLGLNKSAAAAKNVLDSRSNWLMIIDNADDHAVDLKLYFPPGNRGSILVTSRNPDCAYYASQANMSCRLEDMDSEDSVSLLLKTAKMDIWGTESRRQARTLVEKLQRLPLAVTFAGAAIWQSKCTVDEYIRQYEQNHEELLDYHPGQGADSYENKVFTT